jgi:hypothetical protein
MAAPKDSPSKAPEPKKPTSPDSLVKGSEASKVELSEDELRKVSGGLYKWK